LVAHVPLRSSVAVARGILRHMCLSRFSAAANRVHKETDVSRSGPVEHFHRGELPVGKQLPTIGQSRRQPKTRTMGTKSAENLTDNTEEVQRNRNAEMGTVSLALPGSDLDVTEVDPWALTELVDNSPKWSGEIVF
jgi:hypothetical protein